MTLPAIGSVVALIGGVLFRTSSVHASQGIEL